MTPRYSAFLSLKDDVPVTVLRAPDAAIVDPGGTDGKLETPVSKADQWPYGQPHLDAATRELSAGDELLVNDHRVMIQGRSTAAATLSAAPLDVYNALEREACAACRSGTC